MEHSETIGQLSEEALIAILAPPGPPMVPNPPEGPGDDAAVLPASGGTQVVTTDGVVSGVHFQTTDPAELVGNKLVNRNCSDLAAMGARPRQGFLNVSMGKDWPLRHFRTFARGLHHTLQEHRISLNGGDITGGPDHSFAAFLTLIGETVSPPLLRHSGADGNAIWVTGSLGNSLTTGHHLSFEPRLKEGQWLAASGCVTSMVDVSDGLGKELPFLLGPNMVAEIDTEAIPLRSGPTGKPPPWRHAFEDGEDHELLFATKAGTNLEDFSHHWSERFTTPLSCIGKISHQNHPGHPVVDQASGLPITLSGFRHWNSGLP